jgi:hypothetical protein
MRLQAVCLVAVTGYGQDADKVRADARQKAATRKRQLGVHRRIRPSDSDRPILSKNSFPLN